MGSRKSATEGLDESMLLNALSRRPQENTRRPPDTGTEASVKEEKNTSGPDTPKENPKRRRSSADYGTVFLQRNEIKTRQCVYISREVHNKISKIVNIIADKEITVGGYIDTVLMKHLEQHKDEINELYRQQREDLI